MKFPGLRGGKTTKSTNNVELPPRIATFLHTRSFNILRRTGTRVKRKTSENQRFSEEFVGLIDPSVTPVRYVTIFLYP